MKLHAQNQLYTSLSFRDTSLWACLGMPDHANLKSYHQFVALLGMYLHGKNQLHTSNRF